MKKLFYVCLLLLICNGCEMDCYTIHPLDGSPEFEYRSFGYPNTWIIIERNDTTYTYDEGTYTYKTYKYIYTFFT